MLSFNIKPYIFALLNHAIMKHTFILTIATLLAHGASAQIQKGAMALTGTIGFSGSKNLTEETTNNMTVTTWDQTTRGRLIMPAFSYFISEKIEGGLAFILMNSTTMNDYHPTNSFPSTLKERETVTPFNGVGLFGNYYFKNERKYACYGGIQFGLGSGTSKSTNTYVSDPSTTFESKTSSTTFGFNAGVLYFVRHNLALNANFGLLSINSTTTTSSNAGTDTESKGSNWMVGVNGTVVNIGLKYILNAPAPPAP